MPPNNTTTSSSDNDYYQTQESMTSNDFFTSSMDYTSSLKVTTFQTTPFANQTYLMELQHKSTTIMVPTFAYLAALGLIGLIGNSLVLFIYTRKFTRTPTRTFILAIAGFDLITNLVVIPGEVYSMLHHWDMNSDLFCKTFIYISVFTFLVAAMALVAVALARYTERLKGNKKQLTLRDAHILCAVMALASLLFSIPYAIVGGLHEKKIPGVDLYGHECGIDAAYTGRIWPTANAAFLIVLFISCCLPLLVLYLLMCCRAWRGDHVYSVEDVGARAGPPSGDDPKGSLPVVTARSRSYIKKKSADSLAGSKVARAEVSLDGGVGEEGEKKDIDPHDDSNNHVEFVGSGYQARMIRAPTGEKVKVNLSMVRELTVKLKAVQKQAEERLAKETDQPDASKDGQSGSEQAAVVAGQAAEKSDSRSPNTTTDDHHPELTGKVDHDEKETRECHDSETSQQTSEGMTSNDICEPHDKEKQKQTTEPASDRPDGQSETGDGSEPKVATRGEGETQNVESVQEKTEISDESNDKFDSNPNIPNDEKSDTKSNIPNDDNNETNLDSRIEAKIDSNTNIPSDDNADSILPTDFARAMQWIDITYCQQSENRIPDMDEEGGGVDPASLMKKGSFMSSRKVSRDNSFLRKHRKLRDALTDTLTRARKSKKDREDKQDNCNNDVASEKQNDRISEDVNDTEHQDADAGALSHTEATPQIKNTSHAGDAVDDKRGVVSAEIPVDENGRERDEGESRGCSGGFGRTTCMMLVVSLIYIIGALPYLALNFTRFEMPGAFHSADSTGEALYHVFIRAHLLSSAVKPVVYAICNFKFRRACCSLHKQS